MSGYNGRRGPNVSEYIANLNAIPSPQDLANQQDYPNLDEDLAMFTNTQFFDFDLGQDTEFATDFNTTQSGEVAPTEVVDADVKPLDFIQGEPYTCWRPYASFALAGSVFESSERSLFTTSIALFEMLISSPATARVERAHLVAASVEGSWQLADPA